MKNYVITLPSQPNHDMLCLEKDLKPPEISDIHEAVLEKEKTYKKL